MDLFEYGLNTRVNLRLTLLLPGLGEACPFHLEEECPSEFPVPCAVKNGKVRRLLSLHPRRNTISRALQSAFLPLKQAKHSSHDTVVIDWR